MWRSHIRAVLMRLWFVVVGLWFAPGLAAALSWSWSNPVPHGNDIYDMAWNGYLSVQVCDRGQIYTGTDFLGWGPQSSGTTNDLQAVTYFGNRIVFVGAKGTAGYSDDGVNFTTSSLNTANWLVGVAASSNLVVAVGDNAVIYTSPDGAHWQYQGQAPGNNGAWLLSVAWGTGTFVATGEAGYLATSADGTNWVQQTGALRQMPEIKTNDLTHVAYVDVGNGATSFPYTGFWAVTAAGRAIYSVNGGTAWGKFSAIPSTDALWAIAANGTSGVLAGDSTVCLGTSGSAWPEQTGLLPGTAPAWTYFAAVWDRTNGAYRLAGTDGMMVEGACTNGIYGWAEQYPALRSFLWQVTEVGGIYVAVGDDATIMTSDNGGEWAVEAIALTNSISLSNTVFLCVGGNTNLLIAAGSGGSLALSPSALQTFIRTNANGTLSTNRASSLGVLWYPMPAPTTNDFEGVCAFNNAFLLAGARGTLLRSTNGTNWTSVGLPAVTNDLASLACSPTLLVAVGDGGTILTSLNGTNWTRLPPATIPTTNGLIRVRYLGTNFLATGENGTLLRSTNGVNWAALASGTTEWINDAAMISNVVCVVGNNGTALTSTDLVNWADAGVITAHSLLGAATQNGQLVVVGAQGTILRSQVVPNLTTPLFFYDYGQLGGENIFFVSGYPDQRFTLDASTNLVQWSTGPRLDISDGSGTITFITSLGTNPPPRQFYRATLVP